MPRYYHLDRMTGSAARHGADIGCCTACMDARGITDDMLSKGTRHSTLEELADWTLSADHDEEGAVLTWDDVDCLDHQSSRGTAPSQ